MLFGVNGLTIQLVTDSFFVAHVSVCVVDKITLGDEGQMWRLMWPEQYFEIPYHIPQFANRLRLYLSGVVGDPFERAPRKSSGGELTNLRKIWFVREYHLPFGTTIR